MDEAEFGAQVRRARLYEDIDQRTLPDMANISPVTLSKLEHGQGSTLRTIIKVLRALGREEWLGTLEPIAEVSPLALARASLGRREPQRASQRVR